MAIDVTTPVGQVRLLIADMSEDTARQILTDTMIEGYLAISGVTQPYEDVPSWSVRRAAASALDAIATSETLVSKVIRTQDLSTDGAKVGAELRAQAKALRDQATADEDASYDDDSFAVLEFNPYPPGGPELTERRGWW